MRSKRRLRPEIKAFIDKAEMFAVLSLWVYIGIRAFLFMVGIDL